MAARRELGEELARARLTRPARRHAHVVRRCRLGLLSLLPFTAAAALVLVRLLG